MQEEGLCVKYGNLPHVCLLPLIEMPNDGEKKGKFILRHKPPLLFKEREKRDTKRDSFLFLWS